MTMEFRSTVGLRSVPAGIACRERPGPCFPRAGTTANMKRFAPMPRFHLNLFNDIDTYDDDGALFPDLAAAKSAATKGVRALIAELVVKGRPIHLHHRVEVTDETGRVLAVIPFRELITVIDQELDDDR